MANPGGTTRALGDPRRWAVTLGGLAVYGLGSRLWLSGLDPAAATGLGIPALSADLSIFAVGARPILFGLAFVEMARVVLPPLARWAAVSRDHSERLWRTARILALALAAAQAMGMAQAIEGLDGVAPSPGPMFRLGVVAAIVGATAFLIWLARIMTERGVGDGLLVLLAAPLVAHLPYDAAAGVEAVRTGLAPAWAPPALAALVVAAIALLVASARTAGGGRSLDIWPPLLGTIALEALSAFALLADAASGGLLSPLLGAVPLLIRLLLLIAAQACVIWLFAVWRGRAEGADARPLGAEILVCCGALFLSLAYGVGGSMSGPWIIVCVAAALSVANGKAQGSGGLSGPTPTA
jgi:SecY